MKMTHQKVRMTELVENWKYLNCQVSIQLKRVKQKAMSWRERMILKCETKHPTETQMEFEVRIQTVNEMGVKLTKRCGLFAIKKSVILLTFTVCPKC